MFETLSHLYSKAVSLTVGVAPADWTRLWIRGEREEASWSFGGYWERSETDEVIFFEVPYEAEKLTWESWRVSRSHNDSWSTILFRVDRPDKLTITFGREDLNDESYSSEESQAAFRAETFGTRTIRSAIDMSAATSLTGENLKARLLGKNS